MWSMIGVAERIRCRHLAAVVVVALASMALGCGHSSAGAASRDSGVSGFAGRCPQRIPKFVGRDNGDRLTVPVPVTAMLCRYRGYPPPGEKGPGPVGRLDARRHLQESPALEELTTALRQLKPAGGRRFCGTGTGTRYLILLISAGGETPIEVSEVGCGWVANSTEGRRFEPTPSVRQQLGALTS